VQQGCDRIFFFWKTGTRSLEEEGDLKIGGWGGGGERGGEGDLEIWRRI
jgi:hypothetical protein